MVVTNLLSPLVNLKETFVDVVDGVEEALPPLICAGAFVSEA